MKEEAGKDGRPESAAPPTTGRFTNRRDFVKAVALGVTTLAALLAGRPNPSNKNQEPVDESFAKPEPVRNQQPPLDNSPTKPTVDSPLVPVLDLLKATATVMAKENLKDSFKESDGFTREMFEKARKGLFMVEFNLARKQGNTLELNSPEWATAWLAATDEDALYFVTSKHITDLASKKDVELGSFRFWRPNIDSEPGKAGSTKVRIVASKDKDIAVIRVEGNNFNISPDNVVDWEDNATLKPGEKVLVVGYPKVFVPDSAFKTPTLGSVMTILDSKDEKNNDVRARGIMGAGGSGSIVLVKTPQGGIKAVGSVYAHSIYAGGNLDSNLPYTAFYPLDITNLIQETKIK